MGLFDFFKKKPEKKQLFTDLELPDLQIGFFVDFELRTWQVTAYNVYAFDDDEDTREWELTDGRDKRYLECSEDDGLNWTLSKKIPIGKIDGDVRGQIMRSDEPPDRIVCEGRTYYLDETGYGHFYEGGRGKGEGVEFVYWEFLAGDDEHFITIERWSELDIDACEGRYVSEDRFSSILPGAGEISSEEES